jgi:hypothetical protein
VRTKSGFAKNELEAVFANRNVDILYVNWAFKHTGGLSSDDLYDYRDSFHYTLPDILTKFVVRAESIASLAESELGCHFVPGLKFERSKNGSSHNPQFIEPIAQGDIRDLVRKNENKISNMPSAWQLHPNDPTIWLDHFYTRHFDDYFNHKTILGNKQSAGIPSQIRGTDYYFHGLGTATVSTEKVFNSLNFRRLFPKLKRIDDEESPNPNVDQMNKTVYIHMGLPKTGTTAFQEAIRRLTSSNANTQLVYTHIHNSLFTDVARNGLDLTHPALVEDWLLLKSNIDEYINDFTVSAQNEFLVSAEEFSSLDPFKFGIIKQKFMNAGIFVCGIAVIRPFIAFADSFFREYVKSHLNTPGREVLSYAEIARSARTHVEQIIQNCLFCDSYQIVQYSKTNMASKVLDFVYQKSDLIELSDYEEYTNPSVTWESADFQYKQALIKQSKPQETEMLIDQSSFEYSEYSIDSQSRKSHPYYIALNNELEMLSQCLSTIPYKHRWDHLFEDIR